MILITSLVGVGVALLGLFGWRVLAWGCEEPLVNRKRRAWFEK